MASILKIYKTQLTPARNALLDNIEDYLYKIENQPAYYTGSDTLTYTDNNFQYIKPDLDITIKINVPKDNNNLFDSIGNYVRIEQEQGIEEDSDDSSDDHVSIWYYFIIGSRWIAQSTLELSLSLDTINTFGDFLLDEDSWSDKTDIIREHQARFKRISDSTFVKNVDRVGEDINVPILYKQNDTLIEEPNTTGVKEWYLVYKTNAAAISDADGASSNALNCYIYPKTPVLYQQNSGTSGSTFSRGPGDFSDNAIYGITTGGVSFSNVTINGRYFDYKQEDTISVYNGTSTNTYTYYNKPSITGYVNIGDSFLRNGVTYTCYAIVWYKQSSITGSSDRMNLPIGLFRSSNDNKTYYALFITSLDNNTYNEWFFVQRYAWYSWGWHIRIIFSRTILPPTGYGVIGTDLADTTNTSDNWWTRAWDTNWTRTSIYCSTGTFVFTSATNYVFSLPYSKATPSAETLAGGTKYITNGTAGTYAQLSCIDYLDKTDATLVKILALPYCPTAITITSGSIESGQFTISFDSNIVDIEAETSPGYESYFRLLYKDKSYDFGKDLVPVDFDYSISQDFLDFYYDDELKEKDIKNETKLLNSNFYKDMFIYDNVSKTIRREDLLTSADTVTITPYYQPTNTLTSTMMYKFNIDKANYAEITDWDTVLISTRNNELPIYNNDYLNYMRYGYNAEKANLEATAQAQRQAYTTNAVFTIGGGLIGGAGSGAAIGAKFGGGYGAIAGAIIGGVVGLASGIAKTDSAINSAETSISNAQRSLESKVDELKHTASTVQSGYSSVDLMSKYTGNRLHYAVYDTPDLMKEAIWDKFFYCGYNHPVQAIPELDTRLSFNFIQCDPKFINEATSVYNYYLTDIKDRFNTGITVYHDISDYLQNLDTTELLYDWEQKYENWELFDKIIPANFQYLANILNIYELDYSWIRQIGETSVYEQFMPDADNNYRWKITYTVPGDNTEYDYPYSDPDDVANGYTLSTGINPYTDFVSKPVNGTVINLKVIDITDTWANSAVKSRTVYNSFMYNNKEYVRDGYSQVVSGTTYYEWKPNITGLGFVFYTDTETPVAGDNVYNVIMVGGHWVVNVVGTIASVKVYQ